MKQMLATVRLSSLAGQAISVLVVSGAVSMACAQSEVHGRGWKPLPPTSHIVVTVVKEFNGKPLANAAVIFHAVREGKNDGNLEVKTDEEGKATIDVIEVGSHLNVQVISRGFATSATEMDVDGPSKELQVKMLRPRAQVSVYQDNDGKAATDRPGTQEPAHGVVPATKPSPAATPATATPAPTVPPTDPTKPTAVPAPGTPPPGSSYEMAYAAEPARLFPQVQTPTTTPGSKAAPGTDTTVDAPAATQRGSLPAAPATSTATAPTATQRGVGQSPMTTQGATAPSATQRGVGQSPMNTPGAAPPSSTQRGVSQSPMATPGATAPLSTQRGVAQSPITTPDAAAPSSTLRGVAQPSSTTVDATTTSTTQRGVSQPSSPTVQIAPLPVAPPSTGQRSMPGVVPLPRSTMDSPDAAPAPVPATPPATTPPGRQR